MTKSILRSLLASLLLFGLTQAQAAPGFQEGDHYTVISPSLDVSEKGRVTVMEFFWYGCSHCYKLEPYIDSWLKQKPDYVDFVSVPATFNRENVLMHAATYYALKLIGEAERMRPVIFDAMHRQKLRLDTQPEMEALLGKNGVDVEAFRQAIRSFAVQTQVKRAATLAKRFGVRGVPTVVVDGKYRAGSFGGETLMPLTDFLVEKARSERAGQ